MTLRLRRKRRITAPSITRARTAISSGLKAAQDALSCCALGLLVLQSVGASEPGRFTPEPNARPITPSVSSGSVLRWRSPNAVATEQPDASAVESASHQAPTEAQPVRQVKAQFAAQSKPIQPKPIQAKPTKIQVSGWNVSRAGQPVRFANADPLDDPLGERQVAFQQDENVEPFEPPMAPPMAPAPPRRSSPFQPQVPDAAPAEETPEIMPPMPPAPPRTDRNDERSESDRSGADELPPPSVLRRDPTSPSRRVQQAMPGCNDGSRTGRPYACAHPEGLKCLPNDFLDISPRYADLRRLREELDRGGLTSEDDDILEKVFGEPGELPPASSTLRQRLRNEIRTWRRPQSSTDFRRDALATGRIIELNEEQVVIENEGGGRAALPRRDLHPDDEALLRSLEPHRYRTRTGGVITDGYVGPIRRGKVAIVDSNDVTLAEVPLHELGGEELNIVARFWQLPAECLVQDYLVRERNWAPATFTFTASALCHKPLYFEQPQVERYGHSSGPIFQPLISTGKFALDFVMLPYNMAINPPNECQYTLGYYRPGSCAPYMIPPIPLSMRGAIAEAGIIVGGIYLIP